MTPAESRALRKTGWDDLRRRYRQLLEHIYPKETHMENDRLVVHKGTDGQWYWHRQAAGNHEVISQGEGYETHLGAVTGALRANPDMTQDQVHGADA